MIAPDFNLNKRSRTIHSIIFAAMSIFTDSILAVSRSDVINMQRIIGKHKKIRHSVHPVELSSRGSHNQQRKLQICTIAWMSTVSNVTRKGLDRLLLVAKELREYDEFRNLDVIIMGTEGEGTVYLKEIINREKIERVHFMGVIDDSTKLRVLAESKFYGQFSQYEGFGLAALEALNAGCTVIHSGRGGLSDVIGTHGIRINLDQNDKEIAESIVKQLKSFKSNEAQLEQDLRNFDLAARARDIANAVRRNYGVN